MKTYLETLREFFVSLRLTVALLILSMLLVFVATLDQVNLGIWAVQEKYFRSFVVFWSFPDSGLAVPIFPGGYVIGGLLLINLICAHLYRFAFTWRKLGIQLAHAGLILLLLGEFFTGLWQRESYMRLDTGETKSYSESFHGVELVVMDTTEASFNRVVAIPEALLEQKPAFQHPALPFRLEVKAHYPNAMLERRNTLKPAAPAAGAATTGAGTELAVIPLPITYKHNDRNNPAAIVELLGSEGSMGTWMVSSLLIEPQVFTYQGRTWQIHLRSKRTYHPFTLTLKKFSHDKYPGTEIPRNFSSLVTVRSDDGKDDREVLILMNSPLRYRGQTFYQAGFDNNDTTTVLQVVRNPSWLLPYISCVLMFVGLLLQFSFSLAGMFRKRRQAAAAAAGTAPGNLTAPAR